MKENEVKSEAAHKRTTQRRTKERLAGKRMWHESKREKNEVERKRVTKETTDV